MKLRNLFALFFAAIVFPVVTAFILDAQAPVGNTLPLTGQAPGGAAGGVLSGTYPNPGFAAAPTFSGNMTVNPTAPLGGITVSAAQDNVGVTITAGNTGGKTWSIFSTSGASGAGQGTISFFDGAAFAAILTSSKFTVTSLQSSTLLTNANCSSNAAPAVCGSASAGSLAVPTGTNPTLTVNTTAVTANSQVMLTFDSSLGTKLGVTCNTTNPGVFGVTARTAATSFTVGVTATVTTNPACFSYHVVN